MSLMQTVMTQTVSFEGAKYFSMTLLVDVKIELNENTSHLCEHFLSELVKQILYGNRKFGGDSVLLNI